MKKSLLSVLTILCLLFACHQDDSNNPDLRPLSAAEIQVAAGSNDFAFRLFNKIQGTTPANGFISPLSVSMALGMTLNGADDDTQKSFLSTLGCNGYSAQEVDQGYRDLTNLLLNMDKKVELGIANAVWYRQPLTLDRDFSTTVQQAFDAKIQSLDFSSPSAAETINTWVENKTHHRITHLVEDIDPSEVMFLVNALYFKGQWTHQFNKSQTYQAPFTTIHGNTAQVDMMHSKGVEVQYYNDNGFVMADIPYGNKQFSFTIVMPESFDSLPALVSRLDEATLKDWLGRTTPQSMEVDLPRFKMTWMLDLKNTLQAMGLKMDGFPKLFDPAEALEITRVIHKTYLEVNEDGAEAAAATAVGVGYTSAPPQPFRLVIDRPFLFMIREKHSGTILFLGQLLDPQTVTAN